MQTHDDYGNTLEILDPLAAGRPVPEDLLDPQTLATAIKLRRHQAESEGDEVRYLACCRLLCALGVGPIQDVADTLVEQFTGIIEDEDEDG